MYRQKTEGVRKIWVTILDYNLSNNKQENIEILARKKKPEQNSKKVCQNNGCNKYHEYKDHVHQVQTGAS